MDTFVDANEDIPSEHAANAAEGRSVIPPMYDEMMSSYDANFTADISTKMRVPDKIAAVNGYDSDYRHYDILEDERNRIMHRAASMNVPDKIVLLGDDRTAGVRDPRLHLDFRNLEGTSYSEPVLLRTPPRILTLDEHFPWLEEPIAGTIHKNHGDPMAGPETDMGQPKVSFSLPPNGLVTPLKHSSFYTCKSLLEQDENLTVEGSVPTPGSGLIDDDDTDEMSLLRQQMTKLSRHVARLEEENTKRSQRELLLYPLVFGYIFFQIARFFISSK